MTPDHTKQWLHNRQFLPSIPVNFPDWAVTVVFYTALHAVDSLLAHDKVAAITSHKARNYTLSRTNRYAKIWLSYQPLYDLSRTVRYMANPQRWVEWPKIESEVIPRYLYPIETSVIKLAGNMEKLDLIKLAMEPAKDASEQAN